MRHGSVANLGCSRSDLLRCVQREHHHCDSFIRLRPSSVGLESLRRHPQFESEPFVMANLLRFSGSDGRARYFQHYAPRALQLIQEGGGEVVWVGATRQVLVSGTGGHWDQLILVRWPSRRAFLTMLESAEYDELKSVRGDALAETMMLLMSDVRGT